MFDDLRKFAIPEKLNAHIFLIDLKRIIILLIMIITAQGGCISALFK